jgi:hypothetical protein
MTDPTPPSLACFSSLTALYQADLRDLAAAVLWVGCAQTLASPVPELSMLKIQKMLRGSIPELAPAYWSKGSPQGIAARNVLYEAMQVLQRNGLVLWRYEDAGHLQETITLTRAGRAAILSGDIKAHLVR